MNNTPYVKDYKKVKVTDQVVSTEFTSDSVNWQFPTPL